MEFLHFLHTKSATFRIPLDPAPSLCPGPPDRALPRVGGRALRAQPRRTRGESPDQRRSQARKGVEAQARRMGVEGQTPPQCCLLLPAAARFEFKCRNYRSCSSDVCQIHGLIKAFLQRYILYQNDKWIPFSHISWKIYILIHNKHTTHHCKVKIAYPFKNVMAIFVFTYCTPLHGDEASCSFLSAIHSNAFLNILSVHFPNNAVKLQFHNSIISCKEKMWIYNNRSAI